MQCPFCKEEMEKGLLQSGGKMLVWVRKKYYWSLNPKEGEVLLDRNYLTGASVPAWICHACCRVIAEYEEKIENEF